MSDYTSVALDAAAAMRKWAEDADDLAAGVRQWAWRAEDRAADVRRIGELIEAMALLAPGDPEVLEMIAWWLSYADDQLADGDLRDQRESVTTAKRGRCETVPAPPGHRTAEDADA